MVKAAPLESRRANNKVGAVGQEEVVVSRQYVRATVRSKAFDQVKSARQGPYLTSPPVNAEIIHGPKALSLWHEKNAYMHMHTLAIQLAALCHACWLVRRVTRTRIIVDFSRLVTLERLPRKRQTPNSRLPTTRFQHFNPSQW